MYNELIDASRRISEAIGTDGPEIPSITDEESGGGAGPIEAVARAWDEAAEAATGYSGVYAALLDSMEDGAFEDVWKDLPDEIKDG